MNSLKLVFSNRQYAVLAGIVFVGLLIPLLVISEYLFFEPYLAGHIPNDTELGFVLIVLISALAGLVLPMNLFRIKVLRSSKKKMSGGVFGSIIGAVAGACSCGPIGFAMISTFGSVAGTASAFLTNYEIPIRIGAISLLVVTFYTSSRSLKVECKIKN